MDVRQEHLADANPAELREAIGNSMAAVKQQHLRTGDYEEACFGTVPAQ
jgi:hypothetical protein